MSALQELSKATTAAVTAAAPGIVSIAAGDARISGFAWRPGLVVTADEPLPDDGDVLVTAAGQSPVSAAVVGRDPSTDIALLRIPQGPSAPAASVAARPEVGTIVLVVGAEAGAPTAALGVVSLAGGPWRSMRGGEMTERIELDVTARRTQEGGLVVAPDGVALGMLVRGPRRRALVIPAATIERVASQLLAHGRIPRGYLGLALQSVQVDGEEARGLMVVGTDRNGPGAAAGVMQGDVITACNGTPLGRNRSLSRELGPGSIGRQIALTVRRTGKSLDIPITVGERSGA